jgi:hypothetical protein
MGYIGATDLTLMLPANVSIGTNTEPLTLGEVATIIGQYEAEINSAAAHGGYIVPISSSASLSFPLLALNTMRGAGAHVLNILFPNMSGGLQQALADDYRRAYEDFLDSLRDGELILPDAEQGGGAHGEFRSFEMKWGVAPSPMIGKSWDP